MPDYIFNTLLSYVLNKPVSGKFETGRSTFSNRTAMISKSLTAQKLFDPEPGYFVDTACGSRYKLSALPVAVFPTRLAKYFAASAEKMEVFQT